MHPRSARTRLVAIGALLVLTGLLLPRLAAARPVRSEVGTAEDPRPPAPGPEHRAAVDPHLVARLSRRPSTEAILVLDGARALAGAQAALPPTAGSRALLREIVPAFTVLKDGIRARLPEVTILHAYRTLPILHVIVPSRAALERVARDPAVVGVAPDRRLRPALAQSLPLIGQPTAAAAGHTGAGTAVAVLDTGVNYTHPAFGTCPAPGASGCRVVLAQDTASNDGQLDDNGHGTNVAGIVAGVAPDTGILAYDVFTGAGAFNSDTIEAINLSVANQATFNVRAINLSLGDVSFHTSSCGGAGNPFDSAFSVARAAGILPVVAAGNSAFFQGSFHVGIANPACTPGALPVGAVYDSNVGPKSYQSGCSDQTTAADTITCFSQAWVNPMMLAPGAVITAAGITQQGTSQATPHIAGAVAVLQDAAGASSTAATPGAVQAALLASGPLIQDSLVNESFHRLDLPAAIAALGVPPPPTTTTPPPTTTTTTTMPPPTTCTISGNAQSNVLNGTPGDDVLCGEGGNDVILTGGGNDRVIGGPGFDWISLEDATAGATVDLAAGTAVAPGMNVTLEGVEGARGGPFADSMFGTSGSNDFFGFAGNDTIDGRGGFDYARYDVASGGIRADLTVGQARGEGRDGLISIEALVGSRHDDVLAGNGRVNWLYGLGGADLLEGLGRADTLNGGPGPDALLGGTGNDDLFGGAGLDVCDQGPGSGVVSSC